jgi:putative hydroxymethylpyrimidine transport system substrate-binding protein
VNRRRSALLLLALALAVAGCGGKEDRLSAGGSADRLRVMLDFFPNADHVGLYAARERGEFRRAALDVEVQPPPDPSSPLKLLQAGKVDLAISYEPELLLARDKGAKLVAVASIVQRPLTSVIAIKGSKVSSVADLAGKRVGTAGIPYQAAYLRAILKDKPVKRVDVGFNLVPAMLSRRVDATLGGFWNYEGLQLERRNRAPFVLPVDKAGVPTYSELVLVAREETLKNRGDEVRRFVQAFGRGQGLVRKDPAAGVRALIAQVPSLRKDAALQTAAVRATQPAFFPEQAGKPFGWSDRAAWQRYGEWMHRNRLVRQRPNAAGAVTNEFVAGEGA